MSEDLFRGIIMWLPKDERRLLEGYYVNICEVEKQKWFEMSNWIPVLTSWRVKHVAGKVKRYGDRNTEMKKDNGVDIEHWKRKIKEYIKHENMLRVANVVLEKRKLIKIQKHQLESDVAGISLTIDGYDLGRKYSNWFTRSGLWFAEYRKHWIWLIVSFFGGVITGVLVSWLSNVLMVINSGS